MTHHLRIPTKEQYAYIEVEFSGTPEEAFAEYQRLTDLVQGKHGVFRQVETFTDETVLYDAVSHTYKDQAGNPLVSGSQYKKSLEKPFDVDMLAPKVAEKHGILEEQVRDMWKRNGEISAGLGTSLHQAMEQWFKHRLNGTEKNYHLPKHPFLRNAVDTFPLKDAEGYPEIMVSDIANKRVGQIDLLVSTAPHGEKQGYIVDYKSDAEIDKNLAGHFNQLSFYAHILIAKGWDITNVEVWNFTDCWRKFESPVLELK